MRSLQVLALLLLTTQAVKLNDDIMDEGEEDRSIMNSIAYAEKKMGHSMGTPKKVKVPDQPYAPIKYDVENVQLRDDGPDLTKPAFPLGFANAELVKNKPLEAKVVATQQAYESWKEADVASRFAANTASTAEVFGYMTHARDV